MDERLGQAHIAEERQCIDDHKRYGDEAEIIRDQQAGQDEGSDRLDHTGRHHGSRRPENASGRTSRQAVLFVVICLIRHRLVNPYLILSLTLPRIVFILEKHDKHSPLYLY
jgi:hypothetical protein